MSWCADAATDGEAVQPAARPEQTRLVLFPELRATAEKRAGTWRGLDLLAINGHAVQHGASLS